MSKTSTFKPTLNQADIDLLMQSMRSVFPTKVEMEQRFNQVDQRFSNVDKQFVVVDLNSTEIKNRFDEMEKQQFIKYDNVITLLDDIMGELKTIREEQAVMSHHLASHTDQIAVTKSTVKNHGKRIVNLELAANFT